MLWILVPIAFLFGGLYWALSEAIPYYRSTYYRVTKNSYLSVKLDTGRWGEYLTYEQLKKYEKKGGRFLFNLYLPREDGTTTEIDVLLICKKGVFVFESKNYSGWIFGDESSRTWAQLLPRGRGKSAHKERFYNPIRQNRTHIKYLREQVGENVPLWSVIVFSERCTLKQINVESPDIRVIKRDDIVGAVASLSRRCEAALDEAEIEEIYDALYPFTQVDEDAKKKHIDDIEERLSPEEIEESEESGVSKEPVETSEQPGKTEEEICPRCGRRLVLRTAGRGTNVGQQFLGCEGFPSCRFTKKYSVPEEKNEEVLH